MSTRSHLEPFLFNTTVVVVVVDNDDDDDVVCSCDHLFVIKGDSEVTAEESGG